VEDHIPFRVCDDFRTPTFPFAAASAEVDRNYPRAEVKMASLKHQYRPKVSLGAKNRANEADLAGRLGENVSITTERNGNGTTDRVPLLIVRPVEDC
jgi:hypothetical protein